MSGNRFGSWIRYGREMWLVLALLFVAVIVPSQCILWFMREAMKNQQFAARQMLADAYQSQLDSAGKRIEEYIGDKITNLTDIRSQASEPECFAKAVTEGVCDSLVLYGPTGAPVYPSDPHETPNMPSPRRSSEWNLALWYEHEGNDPRRGADQYGAIARSTLDVNLAAEALLGQARCLAKIGETEEAVRILTETLSDPKYRSARDPSGRFIVPNALLRGLELMGPEHPNYGSTVENLAERLRDYRPLILPSSQRRFLIKRVLEMAPNLAEFPTFEAEQLAAGYLESDTRPALDGVFVPASSAGDLWQISLGGASVTALFRGDPLRSDLKSLAGKEVPGDNVTVEVLTPLEELGEPEPILVTPVGIRFPQWRIALSFKGGDPFAAAAEERIAKYLWTAVFVIALIAVLAFLIARHVSRQIRLTRLKNNLIASVSHELKTPLSSMRVLVDTLLEGRYRDEQQVREYLDLISKENLRLSRLIDNFLAFSRMERNKRTFEFKPVVPGEIISEACASVRERFETNGHVLNIEVEPDLPMIHADRDALVTVLINLLDNAYKYSGEDKRVTIRAFSEPGSVFFRVEDNGIGIPRRALRRIFERFYQVDQSLSRSAGGCGLGLSIVKFIVNAHGGHVNVESHVGKGSTFTVKIPARED